MQMVALLRQPNTLTRLNKRLKFDRNCLVLVYNVLQYKQTAVI